MSTKNAIRLSGASILLADTALAAGLIVSLVYGLGPEESLPLSSLDGLERLRRLGVHYTLRELLWLAYPVLLLPQGIALFSLLRNRVPALIWPLTFWSVGLGLGIIVDLFTVGLASGMGAVELGTPDQMALQLARSADVTVRLAQFVCDNLSGTLAVPFFAVSAYRQGLVGKSLAFVGVVATMLACTGYRGVNLIWPESPWVSALGLAWYGVIWWDVSVGLTMLRIQTSDIHRLEGAPADPGKNIAVAAVVRE